MIVNIIVMTLFEQPFYEDTAYLWAYSFIIASVLLGLIIHTELFWRIRIGVAALQSMLIGMSLGLLLFTDLPIILITLLFVIQFYRLFAIYRIIKNRAHSNALRNKSRRTELILSIFTLVLLQIELFGAGNIFSLPEFLYVIASLQFVLALIFIQHVLYSAKITAPSLDKKHFSDADLPSLTVAIPARNETDELNECLHSILQSDYPKLEVLVVDDCSQDNTSDIIKKFAHQGVRFVSGKKPPDSWLAKNYSYHQLLDEAGGKYVMFCGTDVRIEKNSIRLMMEYMLHHNQDMLSVLPIRENTFSRDFILQPMRYWRELAIPRLFDSIPPVLSTCWLARRKFLDDDGGFSSHKKTIRPERIFSRSAKRESRYSFLRASAGLGVTSKKTLKAQWETAKRTRYPELKNRPENILIYTILYSVFIVGSPVVMAYGIVHSDTYIVVFSSLATISFLYVHHTVVKLTSGNTSLYRLLIWPVSVIAEIMVSNYSMWAYEFSEVIWKGRNICLPVLQSSPKLPDLDSESNLSIIRDKDRKRRTVV